MIRETLTDEDAIWQRDYYKKQYPLHFKAMHFIGFGGVATAGQIFRWLNHFEEDQKTCFLTITALIGKRYIRKLNKSQLKKIKQPENALIYYLTSNGFSEVRKICKPKELSCLDAEFILKQIKTGMPHGIKFTQSFSRVITCRKYSILA